MSALTGWSLPGLDRVHGREYFERKVNKFVRSLFNQLAASDMRFTFALGKKSFRESPNAPIAPEKTVEDAQQYGCKNSQKLVAEKKPNKMPLDIVGGLPP